MGWLGNLLKSIGGHDTVDMIYVDTLTMPGFDTTTPIVRDEIYIELYVESLRLEKARKFAATFHGLVYSYVTLTRSAEETATIAAVSKPANIAQLDPHSLGNVITVTKQMMKAIPWRGGTLGLELGLFAIKSGNLLTPVLNFVTKVSETAGISFVGAVKPFVPLITEGMDLLAGQTQDTRLEVGLDTAFPLDRPKLCAIIAAKKDSIDTAKLTVDPQDRKLLLDGHPLQLGYCVFSIRTNTRKADYGDIPELKQAYADFVKAVKTGQQKPSEEALAVFRRAVRFSPDLIRSDANALSEAAAKLLKDEFDGGPVARDREPGASLPGTLGEVGLYS